MFEPGDIVINYRRKYKGPFKYLLTRLICFFTTEWWNNEKTSKTYHVEMIYSPSQEHDDVKDISQEWPCVKITGLGNLSRKAIFRLKNKPLNFDRVFFAYCDGTLGQKYDWLKLISMALYWLFMGNGIGRFCVRLFSVKHKDICSEYVARFYWDWVGMPCSKVKPDYTTPDDTLDYCLAHPEIYDCIFNQEN